MAFIRVKTSKRKNGTVVEYAYIVENRRVRKKKIKQKSKKYLGRVYRFDRSGVMDFYEFHDIDNVETYLNERTKEEILLDLIRLELSNHGFEKEKWIWAKEGCYFDEKGMKMHNEKGNNIAVAFNEGFLTTYAVRKLLGFVAYDEEEGYDFAKMFIEAGIAIPKDVFVGFFRKSMHP